MVDTVDKVAATADKVVGMVAKAVTAVSFLAKCFRISANLSFSVQAVVATSSRVVVATEVAVATKPLPQACFRSIAPPPYFAPFPSAFPVPLLFDSR